VRRTAGPVAIVGGGLAGFVGYLTLVRGGIEPEGITVFGTEADPAAAWRRRAEAIRQTHMRSESDGHCLPTSFPGLAVREARRCRSLRPLVDSVRDRYHPGVGEFLAHVEEQRAASRWDDRFVPKPVGRVSAVEGGFVVDCEGPYRHVLLATGHGGLAVPETLRDDQRVVHSYEPHGYAPTVCIVGAGLAAATEWLNALAAGSTVISVRRREPVRRPLNVPRELLSRRGLQPFRRLPPGRRAAVLRDVLAPSYPPGRAWDEPLERAAAEGRFRVEPSVNGAPQVIAATGFLRGYDHDPLLAALVEEHALETVDGRIVLADDSTVPALTDRTRTLAVAGVAGQDAYPAADTLAGARFAAHRLLRRCRTR
jgi:cation diffusion facilitator CzcD-associated flavoprotein CzcO